MAEITNSSSSAAPASDPAPSAPASAPVSVSGSSGHLPNPVLPRVTIRFCTQCKWMLRAAYVSSIPSLPLLPSSPTARQAALPHWARLRIPNPFVPPAPSPTDTSFPSPANQYAQELLSTFSTGLGEVGLQPSTGGTFIVEILAAVVTPTGGNGDDNKNAQPLQEPAPAAAAATGVPTTTTQHRVLWDRTVDGGFPETKELKRRVRDVIEPNRDLGHVDRDHARKAKRAAAAADASAPAAPQESMLTSSSSSSTPTVVRDTPRQGQSHPRMPVTEDGAKDTGGA
ncbi:hypothetical protein PG997_004315, partial [Apiospora hydei]